MPDKVEVQVPHLGITMNITEEQAYDVLDALRSTFGWEGCEFTRADVSDSLGRPITDEEWDNVQGNYYWHKGVAEMACRGAWVSIDSLISDLGLTTEEEVK